MGEWKKEPKEKWIFMLYDDTDFKHVYDPFYHFWLEAYSGRGVDVVVLQDTEEGRSRIWYIDKYHRKTMLEYLGEVNMGNYTTLRDFIIYCKQNFFGKRYIMDIYNHGGGCWDACIDETDNGWLTMDDIQKALEEAGGIDILMFNAPCLMGNLEAVYELRSVVNVYWKRGIADIK